ASYTAVGDYLTSKESPLYPYTPRVKPQGSFLLGTPIKPIHEDDDIDIDLVVYLLYKNNEWTQKNLKDKVGNWLKQKSVYKDLLFPEGRRCWTLGYRQESSISQKYHMDILPTIVDVNYDVMVERSFKNLLEADIQDLAIRYTDNKLVTYTNTSDLYGWPLTNPFGFAKWFYIRAITDNNSMYLSRMIESVPKYSTDKLVLQRAVQILKRHRDIMFNGDEEKPISIIITTLAAKAYNKDNNLFTAIKHIINHMENHVVTKFDFMKNEYYKVIENPVNIQENFADKWRENKSKERKFYAWLTQVKKDISELEQLRGLDKIGNLLALRFGEKISKETLRNYALKSQNETKFDFKTGISSLGTVTIPEHTFYGKE
ncbi:MAG TPA: nucleotidyltransferase, partial [Saprospiraceae bacterium]|nr:nucleotidyltransferase [Saprospiraceae bacterium]